MFPPREWAPKLVGAVGTCGLLSDHLFCLSCRGGKTVGGPLVLPRRGVTEGLVNAVVVVVVHPRANGGLKLTEVVVGTEVDQFAFKRAPQSLNEDVVYVFDAFRIMQKAGKAFDKVRKELARQCADLYGVLWALRGNARTRSDEQTQRRAKFMVIYPALGRAVLLRELLQDALAGSGRSQLQA